MTSKINLNASTIPVCITIVLIALMASFSCYFLEEKKLMAQNIETAIQKGIDPLSVRCSYAFSDDVVCVTFASSSQAIRIPDLRK